MYVPLHNHTTGSFLDGLIKPEALAQRAKELGFSACGVSDHGSIFSWHKFTRACVKEGLKPILGVEAYFVDDVTIKQKGETRYHLCLWAKSYEGCQTIYRLMTRANSSEFFYYKPRLDFDLIVEDHCDLIVTTACQSGLLSHPKAEHLCKKFKEVLGDDFILEIMPLEGDSQKQINLLAVKYSNTLDIPLIATPDTHYLYLDDHKSHSMLLSMNTQGRFTFDVQGLYLKSEKEIKKSFFDLRYLSEDVIAIAMENSSCVSDSINIEFPEANMQIPYKYNGSPRDVLMQYIGNSRISNLLEEEAYNVRLLSELDILENKGFLEYIVVVADLVRWAKSQKMQLGYGRGSAGGSLLCYILGITGVDPVKHQLLFERFINPERSDWPDIDVDIPQSRRSEVFDYFAQRYGTDKVCKIATVSELQPKSAFQDVCRLYGMEPSDTIGLSKKLLGESIEESIEFDPSIQLELSEIRPKDWQEIVTHADNIKGILRHGSKHAAGIVISPRPMTEFGALEKRGDDKVISWDMGDCEFLGLLKLDILGLSALDKLGETLSVLAKRGIFPPKLEEMPLEVFLEFGKGHTHGIFQFEAASLQALTMQLDPVTSYDTLVDVNALGRPGPLDSGITEEYVDRYKKRLVGTRITVKKQYEKYVAKITRDTYWCVIYQEQIIKILQQVAGYSVGKSDTVRRVIAKSKGVEEFENHKAEFIGGCVKVSNMPEFVAEELFEDLKSFSAYCFNRSHAASYTALAVVQMWTKLYYPTEFLFGQLKWTTNKDKLGSLLQERLRLGVKLLPPNINKSQAQYSLGGEHTIYMGLSSIKGLGPKCTQAIEKQRVFSPYKSLEDFRVRLTKREVTTAQFASLITAGAFDELGINRRVALNDNYILDIGKGPTLQPEGLYELTGDFTLIEKNNLSIEVMPDHAMGLYNPIPYMENFEDQLAELSDKIWRCRACSLRRHYEYKSPVPFERHIKNRYFIIGEAPGEEEQEIGVPFVGRAGQLLFKVLAEVGISRQECYITNVYKCRPLANKLPKDISDTCYRWINEEINITKPSFILGFGNTVRKYLTGNAIGISGVSGKLEVIEKLNKKITVLWSIHPSAALRGTQALGVFRASQEILKNIQKGG
jgi:DNA polymerase III subunit alpha